MTMETNPTRRDLFRGVCGIGFGAVAASFGLSAHGTLAQDAPAHGGVLTYNINGDPPNFDVIGNTTSYVMGAVGPCYNGLVCYDPLAPDQIIGELAERWDISQDGRTYTFHLHRNVLFHDGAPMTAEDVKFTFDVMRAPPAGHTSARASTLSAVDAIEVVDPHTVRFVLTEPSPSLLANLAIGWMVVLPKHVLEKGPMRDQVVGTGPYKLREYIRGTSIELERNENYFVPDRPFLDGVHAYIIPDLGTVMANFRTEQLHVFDYMPADLAREARGDLAETHRIQTAVNSDCFGIHFNTTMKPWDDIRVRKAVALAIDREAVLQTLTRGDGVLSGLSLPGFWQLPEGVLHAIPGYAPKQTADALEQAKALLAEAGFPDGFDTVVLTRRISRLEPWGVLVQSQLQRIGIRARLEFQETAVFTETMQKRQFQINAGSLPIVINDPDSTFGDKAPCDGIMNYSQICDTQTEDLYHRQSIEVDPEARREMVHQLEKKMLEQYGFYALGFANRFQGQIGRVRDYVLHGNPDNNKRLQNVWLA